MYHAQKGSGLPASRMEAEQKYILKLIRKQNENGKPVLSMQTNVLPQSEK